MKKIKKIIALILGVLSLSTLYTVKANAAWVKDSMDGGILKVIHGPLAGNLLMENGTILIVKAI